MIVVLFLGSSTHPIQYMHVCMCREWPLFLESLMAGEGFHLAKKTILFCNFSPHVFGCINSSTATEVCGRPRLFFC